jgi:hypothetical protein
MEVSGQHHALATLPPGKKPPVPIGQKAGWKPEPVWMRWWREEFPVRVSTGAPDYPARILALYRWATPVPHWQQFDLYL